LIVLKKFFVVAAFYFSIFKFENEAKEVKPTMISAMPSDAKTQSCKLLRPEL
jgi:hypothetical protein